MLRIATEEYFESFEEFKEHVPVGLEEELQILKGHLIVEQHLLKYLEKHLPNAKALENEDLKFGRKLSLAKALSADKGDDWLWAALHTLNQVRNEMAHKLDSPKYRTLLQDFVGKALASPELPDLEPPRNIKERVHRALFIAHEAMSLRVNL